MLIVQSEKNCINMLGCRSVPTSPHLHTQVRSPPASGTLRSPFFRGAVSQATSRQASPSHLSPRTLRSPAENKAFVESLVRRHKQTLNHIVQLRKRKLAEELKELKPGPTIGKRSLALAQVTRKRAQMRSVHRPREVEIKLELSRENPRPSFPYRGEGITPAPSSRKTLSRPGAEAESVYLSDLLAMKSYADPLEQEMSDASSVAYRANVLPELGVKVRLPFSS